MKKNYIKIAIRNLLKNKVFSLINILGLALGIAACILIFQYVAFESAYDNFHTDSGNIYRMTTKEYQNDELLHHKATTPRSLGQVLKQEIPEVVEFAVLNEEDEVVVTYEDRSFLEDKVYYADSTFLPIFSFELIQGIPTKVLESPNTAIISQSMAKKYFLNEDPVGKELLVDDGEGGVVYNITGVYKDIPENSHLKFDFLLAMPRWFRNVDIERGWNWSGFITYVKVVDGVQFESLQSKISEIVSSHDTNFMETFNIHREFCLQSLTDIYLYSDDIIMETDARGNAEINYYLTVIAIFILVLAWFNYINLSTAKSTERAREVGIRKVNGAFRYQLVFQFLLESVFLNIISLGIALTLVQISDDFFRDLVGKPIDFAHLFESKFGLVLIGVFVVGSLFAGLYPSFVQTMFKPMNVLKGKLTNNSQGVGLRKFLIVLQFVISFGLVAGILIVYLQIQFMLNHDLGFNPDNIVIMHKAEVERAENFDEIEQDFFSALRNHPNIKDVTLSFEPGRDYWYTFPIRRMDQDLTETTMMRGSRVDNHFFETYEIEVIAGRDFSDNFQDDTAALILNERAIEYFGYDSPEDAIGQTLVIYEFHGQIVGVVENFHQLKLKYKIEPVCFHRGIPPGYYAIKLVSDENILETMDFVKTNFDEYLPGNPFSYSTFEDYYNSQYRMENTFEDIIKMFTILAIIIASLGLFGLSSFEMIQRTKEIGIKKVMGATLNTIFVSYSLRFIKLIGISMILSIPLTYIVMNGWLNNYAFHMRITWWHFVIPTMLILVISFITVSYQIIKTASTNPAQSLRYE